MSKKVSEQCVLIEPDNEINKLLYKNLVHEYRSGFLEIGEKKFVMPVTYKNIADEIEKFEVRDTDIWIISFPKTGTTWSQEMIWMILNDVDFEGAKQNITERFSFIEICSLYDFDLMKTKYPERKMPDRTVCSLELTKKEMAVPRLVKTHLPWCLLPRSLREGTTKAKMVYVARNPKDTCISFYHHQEILDIYHGNIDEFCQLFLADKIYYCPYWLMLDFWERRNEPNILYLTYEEMNRDQTAVIRRASDFLIGKQLSDEKLADLVEHLKFENMKKNPSVNYEDMSKRVNTIMFKDKETSGKFMRSGKVGSYKTEMSEEMQKKFDEWTKKHTEGKDVIF